MNYSDAEMVIATQVAYLNINGNDSVVNQNVGETVNYILNKYGTYDFSTGTYTMKEGIHGADAAQFNTAQNILTLSEQNNVTSWQNWTVMDCCDHNSGSGFYGCLIDTSNGDAIVGCRGSESYDMEQGIKDWGAADIGRLNNPLTLQQADATRYMERLYAKYGNSYDSFSFTGHSLGGSLATHAAITAPKGMQDKTDTVISFDGPGFSDEYLKAHALEISRVADKLHHYEYSWVGELLFQPPGIDNRVVKAHDDTRQDSEFMNQAWRHDTVNIEFDENGNVMPGERGELQKISNPISKVIEIIPWGMNMLFWIPAKMFGSTLISFLYSMREQVEQQLEQVVHTIVEKAHELYDAYLSMVVSGEYEIRTGEVSRMADSLETLQSRMNRIAESIRDIRRNLPYDSASAFYYKNVLGMNTVALESEGKKAAKLADAANRAVGRYNQGDQKVARLMR